MNTSVRVHFGFMDNMNEFDEVFAAINMKARLFPCIGPVPYVVHQSSTAYYYMADGTLTLGDLERAYAEWNELENPDKWVEIVR